MSLVLPFLEIPNKAFFFLFKARCGVISSRSPFGASPPLPGSGDPLTGNTLIFCFIWLDKNQNVVTETIVSVHIVTNDQEDICTQK